jgi:probable rRNA maturation factor
MSLPDLDLAFEVDDDLEPGLLSAAGPLADPLAGAELWHHRLGNWLEQLADELGEPLRCPSYSLGLRLVGDTAIAELNGVWRHQPGPTDVLAFAAQDGAALDGVPPMPLLLDFDGGGEDGEERVEPLELGDIVISLETAARQAPEHGHPLEMELLFLASHGLLHLVGWDHPDADSLAVMLERQTALLVASPS